VAKGVIADNLIAAYNEDGYVQIKGMLDPEETSLLSPAAREDRVLDQRPVPDGEILKAGEHHFSGSASATQLGNG